MIRSLHVANIVFNTPDVMRMGRPQSIQLLLSGTAAADELRKQITADGSLTADQVQISDQLEAHLTGANFQIQPVTPESQAIGTLRTSHWEWRVTPTQRGTQQLELTINAILRINGVDRNVSIKTYDRTINVNVVWQDFISAFIAANWQWAWTTIFVPVVLLAWRLSRKSSRDAA